MKPIHPEEIVVGVHGLYVRSAGRSGLLLPQVAVEWKWDRREFLARTFEKAGLPPDTTGAEILAFMKTWLNNTVGVRDAVMAEPVQRTVGGRLRYVSCLRRLMPKRQRLLLQCFSDAANYSWPYPRCISKDELAQAFDALVGGPLR
ncbi:MAG: AMMECR1 domain-containing protein, partial [Candidatus Thermoplasmatota archaeon]